MTRKRASARCAGCYSVQRVKKDGTFGKHHIWQGHNYLGICPGTGRTPAEVEHIEEEQTASATMQPWRCACGPSVNRRYLALCPDCGMRREDAITSTRSSGPEGDACD